MLCLFEKVLNITSVDEHLKKQTALVIQILHIFVLKVWHFLHRSKISNILVSGTAQNIKNKPKMVNAPEGLNKVF